MPNQKMSASALLQWQQATGHVPMPSRSWLDNELPKLMDRCGTFGAHLGRKTRGGSLTDEPALVFSTDAKGGHVVQHGCALVPKTVSWMVGKRRVTLQTDVIEEPALFEKHAAVFGPGDTCSLQGDEATIGAAVMSNGKAMLLTAGHLLGESNQGQQVNLWSDSNGMSAVAIKVRERLELDYALLDPTGTKTCDNLYRDVVPIGSVYEPVYADEGEPLMLLTRNGYSKATECVGVGQVVSTVDGVYRNLIRITPVSAPGDSGGALVDLDNRLWGFLIGSTPGSASYCVPAQMILDDAGVTLKRWGK